MRVALVGPAHPFKGGVAAHTTATAHALAEAGHDVDLVSWSRLYPSFLYPGELAVPPGAPDVDPYDRTTHPLRWDRPLSWWRAGATLRGHDLVVLVTVVPAQVPALLVLIRSLRRGPRPPAVAAIVHNVVPHETHPGGEALMNRLLTRLDGVLVHSPAQAALAREHGARSVVTAPLPAHLPGGVPPVSGKELAAERPPLATGDPLRVLALGIVRDYKGYDLLLQAASAVPGVTVTVAGEQWGDAGARVRSLAAGPALQGRVTLRPGYVPAEEIPALMASHDVLALPYRHATASQNVLLGHAYGLPVLASSVGTFPVEVQDGADGLLVPPGDVDALTAALAQLRAPGALDRLRAGLPALDLGSRWPGYLTALTSLRGAPDA